MALLGNSRLLAELALRTSSTRDAEGMRLDDAVKAMQRLVESEVTVDLSLQTTALTASWPIIDRTALANLHSIVL